MLIHECIDVLLSIEYEDSMYLGCPLLDDRLFWERVSKLLQENIGRSIEYIADLDFGHLD
jgi:hypothetical protein